MSNLISTLSSRTRTLYISSWHTQECLKKSAGLTSIRLERIMNWCMALRTSRSSTSKSFSVMPNVNLGKSIRLSMHQSAWTTQRHMKGSARPPRERRTISASTRYSRRIRVSSTLPLKTNYRGAIREKSTFLNHGAVLPASEE